MFAKEGVNSNWYYV